MGLFKQTGFQHAFLLFLLLTWIALPVSAQTPSVHWYSDLNEASGAARESNQPMLLDFWADWCDACKVMEKNVYSDAGFATAARGFVTVRIDYDKKTAIARKYGVNELPTLVFTDSLGGELFRHRGFIDAKILSELLRALPADVSQFNRLNQVLSKNKNDFQALKEMGKGLQTTGLFLASNDYYAKALDTKQAKLTPPEREAILTEIGANSLDLSDGQHAAETFEKCLKDFPNSAHAPAWTFELGRSYILADKKDKARKVLERFIQDYPYSPDSEKAKELLASQ